MSDPKQAKLGDGVLRSALPRILAAMPRDWRGTTFRNTELLGRAVFAERLAALVQRKGGSGAQAAGDDDSITTADLTAVGNAEDYLRVSSNISSTLEFAIAEEHGCSVEQVFSFASTSMPVIAVLLTSRTPVRLYHGGAPAPFSDSQQQILKLLGCNFTCYATAAESHSSDTVLTLDTALPSGVDVDGVISPNIL